MGIRKSEIRRLRREIIARTGRVWSKLNKAIVKDLEAITQSWLNRLLNHARQEIASGSITDIPEFPGKFDKELSSVLREAMAYGYWLNYVYLQEVRAAYRGKKYRVKITLADKVDDEIRDLLLDFIDGGNDWHEVIPEDAVKFLEGYVPKLSGALRADVLEKTQSVLRQSLLEGLTLQERMVALRGAAPEIEAMSKRRVEAIARTEITRADTMGRLISSKANSDVIGFEYSAIMDDRVTDICALRHGLVMKIDDERLPENTPPLHVNCRSMLLPLTIYDSPDGILTSHEFDEVPASQQRSEDIETVRSVLKPEEIKSTQSETIAEKVERLQQRNKENERRYEELNALIQAAVDSRDIDAYNALFEKRCELEKSLREVYDELIRAKIEAASQGIIYATGLEGSLDKADIEAIVKLVSEAPENIRKVWNIYEDSVRIGNSDMMNRGAYYSPQDRKIYFDIWIDKNRANGYPKFSTFFHEAGHSIDNAAGGAGMFATKDVDYNLYGTLISEVDEHVKTTLMRLKEEAVASGKSAKSVKKHDAYRAVESELMSLPITARAGISDIYSGCTLNKVDGGFGHATSYWRHDREFVNLEFFAQTFRSSIVNPEELALIKQYVPQSYAIFERILEDTIKRRM